MTIAFTVNGIPQPQGSTRAFVPKGWNRAIVTSDNKTLKPWRQDVSSMAALQMDGEPPSEGPVQIDMDFFFARPKSAKKNLYKTTRPDVDKLARSILDSLTGICYKDDSQVVDALIRKHFCEDTPRAEVKVRLGSVEDRFA